MCSSLAIILKNAAPVLNLLGSLIIAYGAYMQLQHMAKLNLPPAKLPLKTIQIESLVKDTANKVNELVEWCSQINTSYTKSNNCILAGAILLSTGFLLDIFIL